MTPEPKFDTGTELAARRTGMSFQRTRMAADRTLMAVMRTSLSLISFGFTIFQLFQRLEANETILGVGRSTGHFGEALVVLGIAMLVFGIIYHLRYMRELRQLRESMREQGLILGETEFPVSLTIVAAFALLAIGVAAIVSMTLQVRPFA